MSKDTTNSLIPRLSLSILLVVLCAKSSSAGGGDHPWCYNDKTCDSKHWAGLCQSGKVQSPVDFNKDNIRENKTELRLRFNQAYLDMQPKFFIKNNGHTVQVQLNEDLSSKLLMDGDGLKGSYVFSQLHFHWGSQDDKGSEHTIAGNAFPMELHLVHYNEIYKSLTAAVGEKNHRALAVLGIFFEVSSNDNAALKPIIEAMSHAKNVNDQLVSINAHLNVSALLPKDLGLFRYYGSLTTPSCNEIVHWNVFRKAVPISKAQLEVFRNLEDSHNKKMVDNFRPTMALSGRKVTEFDEVEFRLKPDVGTTDDKSPSPDMDYDEAMKLIDVKSKSAPKAESSSGTLPNSGSILYSIVSGFSIYAIITLRLKY